MLASYCNSTWNHNP